MNAEGRAKYVIRGQSSLEYARTLHRAPGEPDRHGDTLTLDVEQGSLRHHLTLDSTGEGVLPVERRSAELRLGSEWAISRRQSVSVSGRVHLWGDAPEGRRAVFPATAGYRLELDQEARFEVAYQAAVSKSGGPEWVLSVGTNRADGPNVYGRYRIATMTRATNDVLVGVSHAWNAAEGLEVSVHAERTLATGDEVPGATKLSWSVGYSGLSRHEVSAQVIDREHRRHTDGDGADVRRVGVYAVDWAHRLHNALTLSSKVALRQTRRAWTHPGEDEGSFGIDVLLAQTAVRVPVGEQFAIEVFGRRIIDSVGGVLSGAAIEWLYHVREDLALGVGASSLGVDDPDLRLVAPWEKGVYFRIQGKF